MSYKYKRDLYIFSIGINLWNCRYWDENCQSLSFQIRTSELGSVIKVLNPDRIKVLKAVGE